MSIEFTPQPNDLYLNKNRVLEFNNNNGINNIMIQPKNKFLAKIKTKINIINHELYNKIEFKDLIKEIKQEKRIALNTEIEKSKANVFKKEFYQLIQNLSKYKEKADIFNYHKFQKDGIEITDRHEIYTEIIKQMNDFQGQKTYYFPHM